MEKENSEYDNEIDSIYETNNEQAVDLKTENQNNEYTYSASEKKVFEKYYSHFYSKFK
jgi:hypothetical protein